MSNTRFALTSAIVLLSFGLMAPDCDCGGKSSGQGSVAESTAAPAQAESPSAG